jgi:hypothetical protein
MSKTPDDDPLAGSIAEKEGMEVEDQIGRTVLMEEDSKESGEKPVRYTHELRVVFQRRNHTSRRGKTAESVFDATEAMKALCQAFFTIKDMSVHDTDKQSFHHIKNFPNTEDEFKKFFDCTPSGQSGNMEVYCTISTSMQLPKVKFDLELYDYLMTNNIYLYPRGYTKAHETISI